MNLPVYMYNTYLFVQVLYINMYVYVYHLIDYILKREIWRGGFFE